MPEPSDIPTEDELPRSHRARRRASAAPSRGGARGRGSPSRPPCGAPSSASATRWAALAAVDVSAPAGLPSAARRRGSPRASAAAGRGLAGRWPTRPRTAVAAVAISAQPRRRLGADRRPGGRARQPRPGPGRHRPSTPGQPTLLAAHAEGLAYPNWKREFGWGRQRPASRPDQRPRRDHRLLRQRRRQSDRLHDRLRRPARNQPGAEPERVDGDRPRRRAATATARWSPGCATATPACSPGRAWRSPDDARARRLEGRRGGRLLTGGQAARMIGPRKLDPRAARHSPRPPLPGGAGICGSADEAEELVQETCVRVLRKERVVRSGDDLAYLVGVMRNVHYTRLRERARRPELLTDVVELRSPGSDRGPAMPPTSRSRPARRARRSPGCSPSTATRWSPSTSPGSATRRRRGRWGRRWGRS